MSECFFIDQPRGYERWCHGHNRLEGQCPQEAQPDMVNHPPHYTYGKFEAIDVIEEFAAKNYLRGTALKYLIRADHKGNTAEDLKKAVWYIQREIAGLEKTSG